MVYIFDVRPIQQTTSMSCWWTCIRMMREYARLVTSPHPALFNPIFDSFGHRPRLGAIPVYTYAYSAPITAESIADGTALPMRDPAYWYYYGVPLDSRSVSLLQEVTSLRPIPDRPELRQWTIEHFRSALNSHGPIMFISNWNAAGQHAVVVNGVMSGDTEGNIVFCDPAYGIERSLPLSEFNRLMPSLAMIRDNPMYLEQAAGVNRIRLNTA